MGRRKETSGENWRKPWNPGFQEPTSTRWNVGWRPWKTGTARKTVKKYKKLLRNRGIAFPDPADQASVDDLDVDNWVVGQGKLAMRLESMDEFTPEVVDGIVGYYADYLGDDWYLDAVPHDWLETNETKLEKVDDDAKTRVMKYRRVHGLLDQDDGKRGFQ